MFITWQHPVTPPCYDCSEESAGTNDMQRRLPKWEIIQYWTGGHGASQHLSMLSAVDRLTLRTKLLFEKMNN